ALAARVFADAQVKHLRDLLDQAIGADRAAIDNRTAIDGDDGGADGGGAAQTAAGDDDAILLRLLFSDRLGAGGSGLLCQRCLAAKRDRQGAARADKPRISLSHPSLPMLSGRFFTALNRYEHKQF